MKPVCLVVGAGAGIGGNVARRFAKAGYHACLCRRGGEEGHSRMVEGIENEGGSASGFILNAIGDNSLEARVAAIESDIGEIDAVIYNLGAQIGDRALKDTSCKAFEMGWRLANFGLFRVASAVAECSVRRSMRNFHPREFTSPASSSMVPSMPLMLWGKCLVRIGSGS